MKAIISFCPDLTDPEAKSVDFGILTVEGDKFISFEWTKDPMEGLKPHQFTTEVLKATPQILKMEVEESWPEWRDSPHPEKRNFYDRAENALEYIAMARRNSSIYVKRVES